MNLDNFSQISEDKDNAIIVLKWLWTIEWVHLDLVNFLVSEWLETHYFNRKWDELLWKELGVLDIYQKLIIDYIDILISKWRKVHLFGISFGWFIALKCAQNYSSKINSIVAIAPLIDLPKTCENFSNKQKSTDKLYNVDLLNWLSLNILRENIDHLKNDLDRKISIPWIITIWTNDWFTDIGKLTKIKWRNIKKYIFDKVGHSDITWHSINIEVMCKFYKSLKF